MKRLGIYLWKVSLKGEQKLSLNIYIYIYIYIYKTFIYGALILIFIYGWSEI